MTASERLKALDAGATPKPWTWEFTETADMGSVEMYATEHEVSLAHIERTAEGSSSTAEIDATLIASLRNALPQIVAVVEAAEHAIGAGRFQAPPGPLPATLTALERVLDGESV